MEKSRSARFAVALIRLYRAASALGWPRCRFYPTCSSYAEDAFRQDGFLKGLRRTLMRILRCHPFHAGGYDPVNS